MSDILLEIESSLADQEYSSNSIQLMLQNLKDDIHDTVQEQMNVPSEKISKEEITKLLQEKGDVDVALVCPKCDNFLFSNDTTAREGKLTELAKECCFKYYKKSQEISRTNLDYWYHFLNNPFKTIDMLPNYTRFLFYSIEGVPAQLRPRVWGMLLNSSDNFGRINNDWCEQLFQNLNDENSPYLRVIVNDLNRIFPGLQYFQDANLGQLGLKNILNAYSLYDSEIGYCQGLPFLIGLILFHFKSNPMTFLAAINIFEKKKNLNFKKIFDEKMSGLKLWFFQFDAIFKKHSPELYGHFETLKIDLKLFTSKWFLSFFAVGCPMQILIKLFDIMIIEGFQSSIYKISLIILNKNKDYLMDINDPEEIHQHLLSKNIWDCYSNNLNLIINDLLNLDSNLISQEVLNVLEEKFVKREKQEAKKLPSPKKNFAHRHTKSSAAMISNSLTVAISHEKSNSVSLETPMEPPISKSVNATPSDAESGFFKFFKYGFSGSPCPTPTNDKMSINTDKMFNNDSDKTTNNDTSNTTDDSSSTCSHESQIFDVQPRDCDSSTSSTTSPVPPNDDDLGKQNVVKDIIVSSPDMALESNGLNLKRIPNKQQKNLNGPSASSSFSSASQLDEQIHYFANIPPPNSKTNSTLGPVFGTNAHSRSLSELNDFACSKELPLNNHRVSTSSHAKNHSISNFSIFSSTTDASTFSSHSLSSSLSPQSQTDPSFPSLTSPPLKGFNGHRGHSYSPSISSISSVNKKTRSELKELEMASEIESLKYKLEIYEKIMNDDKKLVKNLFKLYLMKDDLLEDELSEAEKEKLSEKLKKREYKVLKEVDERLRM